MLSVHLIVKVLGHSMPDKTTSEDPVGASSSVSSP
jgi:hypothetical protein